MICDEINFSSDFPSWSPTGWITPQLVKTHLTPLEMKILQSPSILISSLVLLISVSQGVELPLEAKKLADQRSEAIQKIDAKYVQELEKIKVAYTKRGDLDSANAVAELIEKVNFRQQASIENVIDGVWKRDHDGRIWTFDGKGSGIAKGGGTYKDEKFTVVYDAEKRQFRLRAAKWKNVVSYGPDRLTLIGDTLDGGSFQLKRIE